MSTITRGTWARVRLHPDCPGDGPHHPAEDGCRVQVTSVARGNGGDHTVFAPYKGRVVSFVGPRPDGGLGIGPSFRPDELELIPEPP